MMLDRRTLLAGAGSATALAVMGRLVPAAHAAQIKAVGIQLYTVRDIFQKDPAGTLAAIAKIGYREIEFGGGGYDTMDPAMLRRAMDEAGLRCPSLHIGYDALLGQFDKSVAMARALGAQTVVLPYMTDQHRTEAGWNAALPNFNKFARELKKAGFGFAYHNHDFEFTNKPGGVTLYDRFLKEGGSPEVLFGALYSNEPRTYSALLQQAEFHCKRLYSYHVKDMRADGSMAAVGTGTIDFAALFKRKASAGVHHFYVENDQAPAPYLPDITTSFKTLQTLRF